MRQPVIHIVGAGLAGLAAAVRLAANGATVAIYEAAGQSGGRCRSYHDAVLDTTIDNGNHVILSGNHAALDYLRVIGAQDRLIGPPVPEFEFFDLASRERWRLRPNEGRLPIWIFDKTRRVPGSRTADYLGIAPLLWAGRGKTVGEVVNCSGLLYKRLWQPLLLAALNTDPVEGSAALAAAVMRETLAAGGHASRPLIAPNGLSEAFVDPALRFLKARGIQVDHGKRLRAISFSSGRINGLEFGEETLRLGPRDQVILAVPAWVATSLVPGLTAPTEFRAIVNGHFRVTPPPGLAPMIGVINGTVEWIFSFDDRLSITISGADRLLEAPREALARELWREVAAVTGIAQELPPWQIIKERRATFAALPAEDAKRPQAATPWANLVLAGDWTATGLPATIEGAIRSGNRAAELILMKNGQSEQ